MNKYTKNQIWFNLEKIISIVTAMSIITLTAFLMSSCTTSYKVYNEKFHKNYCDKVDCVMFANK